MGKELTFHLCKMHLKEIKEVTGEDYKEKYTVHVVETRDCELCKEEGVYESLESVIVNDRDLNDDDCESGVCPVR